MVFGSDTPYMYDDSSMDGIYEVMNKRGLWRVR